MQINAGKADLLRQGVEATQNPNIHTREIEENGNNENAEGKYAKIDPKNMQESPLDTKPFAIKVPNNLMA